MSRSDFTMEPKNKFAEAIREIAEYEIRPGNTVSFAAEVDLTEIEHLRAGAMKEARKPSYTSFVVKAVALALRDFPYANRRLVRHPWGLPIRPRLQKFNHIDIAVAVECDFPGSESIAFMDTLRNADKMSLADITKQLQDLATCDLTTNRQWRDFHKIITWLPIWLATFLIRLPNYIPSLWVKLRGGATLVSSPAKYGVDLIVGSWTHPVGVSFGLVKPRPIVIDGEIVVRPTFMLTLNFDRRIMAGAQAARFFRRIVERLERAESEFAP